MLVDSRCACLDAYIKVIVLRKYPTCTQLVNNKQHNIYQICYIMVFLRQMHAKCKLNFKKIVYKSDICAEILVKTINGLTAAPPSPEVLMAINFT